MALTEINFIDVPSATQSTVIFTNNTQLKQSDEDIDRLNTEIEDEGGDEGGEEDF